MGQTYTKSIVGAGLRQGSENIVTRQQTLLCRLQDRLLPGVSYGRAARRSARTQHFSHQSAARHASSTSEDVVSDGLQSSIKAPWECNSHLGRRCLCFHRLRAARCRTSHRRSHRSVMFYHYKSAGFAVLRCARNANNQFLLNFLCNITYSFNAHDKTHDNTIIVNKC